MRRALNDYVPQQYDKSEIARMGLMAIVECSSKSLLPDNYEELARQYFNEMMGRPPVSEEETFNQKLLRSSVPSTVN